VQPTIGKQVSLPDENWSAQSKTVVLALQTTCRFCHESAPFYKRLIESAKGKNIKFVAVFPQAIEESTAYLNKLGLTGLEAKQAPISQLEASGTPTLILTNERGEVISYWVGKLTPDKEIEVVNKVIS
jgi:thioredoxin-related protein